MFSEKTFSKDEECDVEIQCRCVEMYTNKNSSDIKALGEQVVFFLSFPPFFIPTLESSLGSNFAVHLLTLPLNYLDVSY